MDNDEKMHVEIGKDYLIHVFNDKKINYVTRTFGNDDNMIMEILCNYIDNSILSVNCILSVFMSKGEYKIPDKDKLKKLDKNELVLENMYVREYFRIIYNKSDANIVLRKPENITSYYTNGRVDFYFTDELYLCAIRIRDLNKEEYAILHDEENNYGNYMEVRETKKR